MSTRRHTILYKILIPLLLAMLLQAGLIFSVILFGGTTGQLKANAYDMLTEKVESRKNDLENEMIQRWSNMSGHMQSVLDAAGEVLEAAGAGPEILGTDRAVTDRLLRQLSSPLLYMLRTNSVSGVFVVFEGDGAGTKRAGLYLRDSDPSSNPGDNSDLLVVRGPSSVIAQYLNIPMDTLWQPSFILDENDASMDTDYYFKPLAAARRNPGLEAADLAYWSRPFYLNGRGNENDSTQIITYSLPLLYGGVPIGVLGVEVSTDHLKKWLPSGELQTGGRGGYLLAVRDAAAGDGRAFACAAAAQSGSLLRQLPETADYSFAQSGSYASAYTVTAPDSGDRIIDGSVSVLKLYNSHTPFENDQWILVGLSARRDLLADSLRMQRTILLSLGLSLLLGIFSILLTAKLITKPVTGLAQSLRQSDPTRVIRLQRLGITEIDELSDSIELLSRQVADSASRLSKILELAGVDVGAFENDHVKHTVYCTDRFFEILSLPAPQGDPQRLPGAVFERFFYSIRSRLEETDPQNGTYVFRVGTERTPRWIRLKVVKGEERDLGVIIDITAETTEKRKIEHDRDYDLLTNIYNRRAFHHVMQELFQAPDVLKTGALIMVDLDNLKYINDTYGHDYGDEYIRCAAEALAVGAGHRSVVARMSGDEFYIFLYGGSSKDEIRNIIRSLHRRLLDTVVLLPGQESIHIRASAGIAWFPEDSGSYEELIRFADFAMYKVKRTNKGQFNEFDREVYDKERYLLQCKETLNVIIEQSLVRYQFQPIVDAKTGEVFAYEALMRPESEVVSRPDQLLALARSQSALPQIERLTWFMALSSFSSLEISRTGCRLFLNSIASQCLTDADAREIERLYGPYLSRVVVELTEEERQESDVMQKKLRMVARWNARLALDDFGSGYNGEAILVDTPLQYVKLDMSITRHIDIDHSRLKLLQNLVSFSKERGIGVIAEGVETAGEMRVLIENGVDYLQGYYLGRPAFEPGKPPASLAEEIRRLAEAGPAAE